jgi:hypothetical protein
VRIGGSGAVTDSRFTGWPAVRQMLVGVPVGIRISAPELAAVVVAAAGITAAVAPGAPAAAGALMVKTDVEPAAAEIEW